MRIVLFRRQFLQVALSSMSLIPASSCFCQQPLVEKPEKLRRYQVILRVVRPRWRKAPPAVKAGDSMYTAILGAPIPIAAGISDTKILGELNKLNPTFYFDRIRAKTSFELAADQIWSQPEAFSIQSLQFAVIAGNPRLLNSHAPSRPVVSFD